MRQAFIGVDVGTTSARAGLFDAGGKLLATARRPIALWREAGDIAEQSSEEIWQACASAVREVLAEARLRRTQSPATPACMSASFANEDPANGV